MTMIMSISVRPVHIEWFPFSFVFSHVSLATTLQLTSVSRNDQMKARKNAPWITSELIKTMYEEEEALQ